MKWIKKFIFTTKENKVLIIRVIILSGFFRFIILFLPFKVTRRYLGKEKRESCRNINNKNYKLGKKISKLVNKICELTPWESKCLVRALIIKYLLKEVGIDTTIYLGVDKKREMIEAHAWLRMGQKIISGKEEMPRFKEVTKFS